jgi:hypothetical protein
LLTIELRMFQPPGDEREIHFFTSWS